MNQTTAYIPHSTIVKITPVDKMQVEIHTRVGTYITNTDFIPDANGINGLFTLKPPIAVKEERFF